ncbi:MAG: HU family DNA-binding protein [Methylocystis sp.]
MLDEFFRHRGACLGEPVKLRSFGDFKLRSTRERIGRGPKTGAEATISKF